MSSPQQAPIEDLVRTLRRLGPDLETSTVNASPTDVRGLVEKNPDLVAYQHPLGFFHIELTPAMEFLNQSERLRLHVWTPESLMGRDDLGAVHDHTWDLRSFVLAGNLSDVEMQLAESADGEYTAARVTYEDPFNPVIDPIEGYFAMAEYRRRKISAGYAYYLSATSLHLTEIEELPVATIVLATQTGRRNAIVVGKRSEPTHRADSRQPIPFAIALDAVRRCIAS